MAAYFDNLGYEAFGPNSSAVSVTGYNEDELGWVGFDPSVTGYKYSSIDGKAYVRYSNVDWLDISGLRVSDGEIYFDVDVTEATGLGRSAYIWCLAQGVSGTIQITYRIQQFSTYQNLWSPSAISLTSKQTSFRVYDDKKQLVFEGLAYDPRKTGAVFDFSSIIQNILQRPYFQEPDGSVEEIDIAKMYYVTDTSDNVITVLPYIYNWDYKNEYTSGPEIFNLPIDRNITPNMYPTVTAYRLGKDWNFDLIRGGAVVETFTPDPTYIFTPPVTRTTAFFNSLPIEGDTIKGYKVSDPSKTIEYNVVCGDCGLYYLNKKGAYDLFVIEGNARTYDVYNKTSYTQHTSPKNLVFSDVDISNRIETEYELVTGWLTDEQSEIVATQLLPSLSVYLQKGDTIVPVNITNSKVEHKCFKNGRNLNQYTITCNSSKYRINK